jgi:hypothetical protein
MNVQDGVKKFATKFNPVSYADKSGLLPLAISLCLVVIVFLTFVLLPIVTFVVSQYDDEKNKETAEDVLGVTSMITAVAGVGMFVGMVFSNATSSGMASGGYISL